MKKEIEICVKSNISFNELKKSMLDLGFSVQEDFQLNDIYMIKKEKEVLLENKEELLSNYVLVRETVGKKILLVLKQKNINEKGEILSQTSIKCPILNKDDGYNFMASIGYKKLLELNTRNILLTNGKNEIYIQDVNGLGTYLEMEQKNLMLTNSNGDTIEELIENLKKYKLPIDETNFFVRKANDMLIKLINENN